MAEYGRRLKVGLLLPVLFVLVSLCLYSDESPLTEDDLKGLTEDEKIQLILDYDNSYTMILNVLSENDLGFLQREIELDKREKDWIMRNQEQTLSEISLIIREQALDDAKSEKNEMFWIGFLTGQTKGSFETLMVSIYTYNNR